LIENETRFQTSTTSIQGHFELFWAGYAVWLIHRNIPIPTWLFLGRCSCHGHGSVGIDLQTRKEDLCYTKGPRFLQIFGTCFNSDSRVEDAEQCRLKLSFRAERALDFYQHPNNSIVGEPPCSKHSSSPPSIPARVKDLSS